MGLYTCKILCWLLFNKLVCCFQGQCPWHFLQFTICWKCRWDLQRFALWMVGNALLAVQVQRCLHSLHLAAAASASRNCPLYCCPDHCCPPWGKGWWSQWTGCSPIHLLCSTGNLTELVRRGGVIFSPATPFYKICGPSWMLRHLSQSFLPLVRAGERILCVAAASLWSSSCLLTAGSVLGILCATAC